jgi:hypothetical protein
VAREPRCSAHAEQEEVRWPPLAIEGVRWPPLAIEGVRWPPLAIEGVRWPLLAIEGGSGRIFEPLKLLIFSLISLAQAEVSVVNTHSRSEENDSCPHPS